MAYTHSKYEVELTQTASGISATTTGNKGNRWGPGYMPHIIRAFSAVVTVAFTSGAVLKLRKGAVQTTATLSDIGTISLTTTTGNAGTIANVITVDGLDTEVAPGEEVVVVCTNADAAGQFKPTIYVEPRYEQPGNITTLSTTAAT